LTLKKKKEEKKRKTNIKKMPPVLPGLEPAAIF